MIQQGPYKLFKECPIRELKELTSIECGCVKLGWPSVRIYNAIEDAIYTYHDPQTMYTTPFLTQKMSQGASLWRIKKTLAKRFYRRGWCAAQIRLGICLTHGICWYWRIDPEKIDANERERMKMIAVHRRLLNELQRPKNKRKV